MSTLKVGTIQNASGVEVYTAKAWVNFNGTGTVAIRASGNVSSITDNGTGDYTVNFTNAMPDANYATVATCGQGGNGMIAYRPTASALTTTQARFNGVTTANAFSDMTEFHVAIFR